MNSDEEIKASRAQIRQRIFDYLEKCPHALIVVGEH